MRILFIGSVIFSKKILTRLIKKKYNLCGIISKNKSNFNSDFLSLKPISKKYKIKYLAVQNINTKSTIDWIKKRKPDIILCCGWSQLISKKILDIPTKLSIGYHPSDLPFNRGRHPIIWTLALGLTKTYSSFFVMSERPDSGYLLEKKKVKIYKQDDSETLYKRLNHVASDQIVNLIERLKTISDVHNYLQKKNKKNKKNKIGNVWRKRNFKDGLIDWRMSADHILNLIKALSFPYPNAHMIYKKKIIKVQKAKILKNKNINIEPGKVLKINKKGEFIIKTGKDSLLIKKIKPKIKINDKYL